MITKRTALILGAGSNVHLGYPLGAGLVSEICSRVIEKKYLREVEDKFTREQIEAFRKRLSRSGYASIDAFLEHNLSDSELGKLLIADCLKQIENEDRLFPPNEPGWYRNLFDALAAPTVDTFVESPLTIITFNYDRSIEAFLHQSIKYRYNLSDDDACRALQSITIIHPHGILGEYPEVPYQTSLDGKSLSSIAERISIIYELRDADGSFCNDAFRQGNEALQQAELIVFLGFGFHDDNIRRLRFFSGAALEGKRVVGTLMVSTVQRRQVVERLRHYGLSGNDFYSGGIDHFFCTRFEFD